MTKSDKNVQPTIHDIAEKLNLAASTVSRALHNHANISEATKVKVRQVAHDMNYKPNDVAVALKSGKSRIIALVVPWINKHFFSKALRTIEERANELEYKVIICQTYDVYEEEVLAVNALMNTGIEGLILSTTSKYVNLDHLKTYSETGKPVVLMNKICKNKGVDQVITDDYYGAFKAVEHLISQGFKRIACFTNDAKFEVYETRLNGYKEALKKYNIAFEPDLVISCDLGVEDGQAGMTKLLASYLKPDAIFSTSDVCAMGILQILKEQNIRIPEDMGLVGFDNEIFSSFCTPTLTSVDQLGMEMGKIAVNLLFEQLSEIKNNRIFRSVVLKPHLVIRDSSSKIFDRMRTQINEREKVSEL